MYLEKLYHKSYNSIEVSSKDVDFQFLEIFL